MPTKNLVLHEGQLAEKTVVESHQPIELGQLQAEVDSHQANVDALAAEVEATNARHAEATAALEDSKSNLSLGSSLVEVPAESGSEDEAEVGTSEPSEDSAPVDVPVNVL